MPTYQLSNGYTATPNAGVNPTAGLASLSSQGMNPQPMAGGGTYTAPNGAAATPNANATPAQIAAGQSYLSAQGYSPMINSSTLAPTAPITIPSSPASTIGTAGLVSGGNSGLAPMLASLGYTYNSSTGQYSYTPQTGNSTSATEANLTATKIAAILGTPPPPSEASIYNSLPQQATVNADQQQVNDYTAQLNSITANQQANLLTVRDQESQNGGTEGTYGGASAEINREAAIQALPVQAQLAAAQGNLQFAQNQLNTVFSLYKDDAQSNYTYQTGLITAVLGVANDEETQILNQQNQTLSTNTTSVSSAINDAQTLSQDLMSSGQSQLAAQVSQIPPPDPNSPTFTQDMAAYKSKVAAIQAQYTAPAAATPVAVTNGAVNAGMNVSDFAALPTDVQDFFNKSSDTQIAPFQTNLQSVATGQMSLADFNKWISTQNVSPAVSAQFQSWAATAASSAPAQSSATWWNPLTW